MVYRKENKIYSSFPSAVSWKISSISFIQRDKGQACRTVCAQKDLNISQHTQHILGQKRLTIKQGKPLTPSALPAVPMPPSGKEWAAEVGLEGGVANCKG